MTQQVETLEVHILPINSVYADDSFNCRGKIQPFDVKELADSIRTNGLLQPVLVQELTDAERLKYGTDCQYRLLAGFRRHMAHLLVLQSTTIQACVSKKHLTESEAFILNLAENLEREDLTIMQESRSVARLVLGGMTDKEVGAKLGKSRGWVSVRLMLLNLPREVQAEAELGNIGQMQIRELYTLQVGGATEEKIIKAVRALKHAKETGKQATLKKVTKKNLSAKRARNKGEIFSMMEVIQKSIGNNIATRAMAWCTGEISTEELVTSLEEFDPNFEFIVPDDDEFDEGLSV
jgi:ParB family chromosome partitioning protein